MVRTSAVVKSTAAGSAFCQEDRQGQGEGGYREEHLQAAGQRSGPNGVLHIAEDEVLQGDPVYRQTSAARRVGQACRFRGDKGRAVHDPWKTNGPFQGHHFLTKE